MASTISIALVRCELTGIYLNEVEQSFRSNGESGEKRKAKNIREAWWQAMVGDHDNIVGLDSAIFMHPKVWEASGQ